MSAPDHSRFEELLSRYLDASLGDAEEHELLELLSDENLATRFYEATQLDTEIAGVLAGSLADEVMIGLVWSDLKQGSEAPRESIVAKDLARWRRNSGRVLLPLAAMVVILLVGAAIYSMRTLGVSVAHSTNESTASSLPAQPPEPVPVVRGNISEVQGEVYFVGSSGSVSLSKDQPVTEEGTIKTVGPDSRATLTLADGTRIEILGDTKFTAALDPEKRRLFLERGVLRAQVTKQPSDNPLIFQTPYASAIVRGTGFGLLVGDLDVYLVVFKGTVGVKRGTDEPELAVEAGRYTHIEPSGDSLTWPVARLSREVREAIEQ